MASIFDRFCFISLLLSNCLFLIAQTNGLDSSMYYNGVSTYVNPELPGDQPDPTLLKIGDDFYHWGSGFHQTSNLMLINIK
jgi:xylan 1,4-beta-xylosidase